MAMRGVLNLTLAAALAAMLVLSAGTAMAELATIEGEATYRERIALRPGVVLEVELLDISRADAPSERLASIRIKELSGRAVRARQPGHHRASGTRPMPSELGSSIGRFGLIAAGGYAFGPIGAAAGALLGGFLFGSSGPDIEGPRLGDLDVSSSTYAGVIPLGFGVQELAGAMIRTTDIDEDKNTRKEGGGLFGVQGQVPIPFTLHYDPALIQPNRTYAVTAKLILEGKAVFRSDTIHPVLTRGAPDRVEIPMVRIAAGDVASPGPAAAAGSSGEAAALVGPTWVAEDIQGRGVIDDLQSHITFTAEGQAHGSGGCNNFTGGYRLEGATLALGPLASTKKACPPAIMNQEAGFHEALGATRGYRFENGLLFLLDAQGAPVMRLWRRE